MTRVVFTCTNCGAFYRAMQKHRHLSAPPRSFNCAECNVPVYSWEGRFSYVQWRRFVPAIQSMQTKPNSTKQSQASDAIQARRLLLAFRSIRDRAARLRIVEMAEAMAVDNQAGCEAASEHNS